MASKTRATPFTHGRVTKQYSYKCRWCLKFLEAIVLRPPTEPTYPVVILVCPTCDDLPVRTPIVKEQS